MAELKTKQTDASVEGFLGGIADPQRQRDARDVVQIMAEASGEPATLWGAAIIGFGKYDYTYASGRSGSFMRIGLSPRKQKLVLYLMDGYEAREDQLARLGKHKIGKSCLYLNKLADIDLEVLRELIDSSLAEMRTRYPE